jgi:hypothetical protein
MHNYSLLVFKKDKRINVTFYKATLAALCCAHCLRSREVLVQTLTRKQAILSADFRDILQSV